MDPDNLPQIDPSKMNFASGEGANAAKAWKDIWGCGQGIGTIREVVPAGELVARFKREYQEAKAALLAA
jgi:nitronate monooxygenase